MSSTDIRGRILEAKRLRLANLRARPLEELCEEALKAREKAFPHLLRDAIARTDRLNIIAEIKRASPWQDAAQTGAEPAELALAYSNGGAAAISIWTEEDYFHGSLDELRAARAAVSLPVLRKDFIIEPCQVYETAVEGATLIGVDNRNPSTLEISLDVSVEVARAAPEDVLLVSENGLRTRKHLRGLRALGYRGFLIGESPTGSELPDGILRDLL